MLKNIGQTYMCTCIHSCKHTDIHSFMDMHAYTHDITWTDTYTVTHKDIHTYIDIITYIAA